MRLRRRVFTSSALLAIANFLRMPPGAVSDDGFIRFAASYVIAITMLSIGAISCIYQFRITWRTQAENLAELAKRRAVF